MKIHQNHSILIVIVLFIIIACDSKRVFDSYVTLPNQTWNSEQPVDFSFTVKDTIHTSNLFINIRNNSEYAFSNLFLITSLVFPDGKKVVDTLEYEMADATGKFLGNGFAENREHKLFYKEQVVFPNSGTYKISISQAMRKNGEIDGIQQLKGITEVGFRIENK